uniref:heavy metal-associated isoprenylated plant protein 41-like n=1 Tax=Erigeron canadensis TaxID=72917 RepID=UPI001CB94AEE|nr:heavy metal-associated isoprenylated plant protein 41-like [Erigeron canadensis]
MPLREEENPVGLSGPNQPNSSSRRSGKQKEVRWLKHYSSDHRILLVGEGDFSFSLSLALAFGDVSNIVATSFDSYDAVIKKYKGAKTNMEILRSLGAQLLHEVDALQMNLHKDLQKQKFDRIIFNFPHAGFLGLEDDQQVIMIHRILVCGFLKNASEMLHPKGEIHVTHKTSDPFHLWNIEELATQNSLTLLERVNFRLKDYPGYHNKRGDGDRSDSSFPLGACSTYKFVFFSKGAKCGPSAGRNKVSQKKKQPQKKLYMPQQYCQQVTQRPFGNCFAGLQPSGAVRSAPHYFPAQAFSSAPQQPAPVNLFGQPSQYPTATYGSDQQLPLASLSQGQQSQPTTMPDWSAYGHAQPNSWPSYTASPTLLYGEQGATSTDLASAFSSMSLQPPQADPMYYTDTGAPGWSTYDSVSPSGSLLIHPTFEHAAAAGYNLSLSESGLQPHPSDYTRIGQMYLVQ